MFPWIRTNDNHYSICDGHKYIEISHFRVYDDESQNERNTDVSKNGEKSQNLE